ncbi:MAG TPA: hypothetical protein VFW86_01290 [Candidatus Limnocylindrales bacterium]|nr:hypothetical protein [Candidatus Limnocylindrales bacterium]
MARSFRIAILVGVLATLVVGVGAVAARPGHGRLVDTSLAGLPATFTGKLLAGVTGAGHPWDIQEGHARLDRDGQLELEVQGLVLSHTAAGVPPTEGTNPIPTGRAVVSCNGGADIVMSDIVNFSVPTGDAEVDQKLALPSQCLAPTVFFTSAGGAWFAVSG